MPNLLKHLVHMKRCGKDDAVQITIQWHRYMSMKMKLRIPIPPQMTPASSEWSQLMTEGDVSKIHCEILPSLALHLTLSRRIGRESPLPKPAFFTGITSNKN